MFKPEDYIDSINDLLDDEQTLVAENIVKSPLDMQERYMSLVPDELLDFIVKQWRPGMTSDQADKIFRKYSSFNQGGSVTTPKRGLVNEAGSYAGRKVSEERLKYLDEAAKKYGYKDFASVEGRANRINVAKDATRREKGVAEGKGRPGVQKDYQVKTGKKDLASDAYLQAHLRRTKNQADILEVVQSGKYKTAEEIRAAVKLDKEVFNNEVKKLFKNVYAQIGNLNKPKKVQSRFGIRFLPRDLEKLYEIRSKLGQVDGFESTEQRNIYSQIERAYGQFGETPNRKAYQESVKKASDFSKIKNAIKAKYPEIVLELDHPLDYKTIAGLGKKGEKFLYVTPIDKTLNRGFKTVLGKAYRTAVNNKDIETISKIENFAKDIGVTVGKVRGSKVMDYGTSLLRETDIGSEIISNLRQQNVIADKIKTLQKSGELKTIFKDIGMSRGAEKGFNIKGVSEAKLKGIENLIKKIGCTDLAAGGRVGFETGANCLLKGVEKINSGKIAKGAEARNFAKFANQAYKLGRGVLKYGIVPEAIFIGAESLVRMGMGDTLTESLQSATSYLPGGTAREDAATRSRLEKSLGKEGAAILSNVRNYQEKNDKLQSLINNRELDLAIASTENPTVQKQIEDKYKTLITKAEDEAKRSTVFESEIAKAEELEATREDVLGAKNPLKKFIRGNIGKQIQPDESLLSYDLSFPEITQEDLNKRAYTDEQYYPRELMQLNNEQILKAFPEEGQAIIDYKESIRKLPMSSFDYEQLQGFNIPETISRRYKYDFVPSEQGTFASGGLASLTRTTPPKRGPNYQGLASLPKYGKQY